MDDVHEYHGIVINISQKDKRIFAEMDIVGKRSIIPGILILYKIMVNPDRLEATISKLQENLRGNLFYFHLYQGDELIAVFRHRILIASPDPASWSEIVSYGRSMHIPRFWLDFKPCRFEDEQF